MGQSSPSVPDQWRLGGATNNAGAILRVKAECLFRISHLCSADFLNENVNPIPFRVDQFTVDSSRKRLLG